MSLPMYGVAFGPQGLHWGPDRKDAMFTIYVAYPGKDPWDSFCEACKAYDEEPIAIFKSQDEARDVAPRGLMFAPIPTHRKAALLAWMYGGFR